MERNLLTIDEIVEKYISLGSEKTFVTNLTRIGMSAAVIKSALEQHRAHAGSEAERKQQVDSYRADLMGMRRHEQITAYLSLFGSHERALPLLTSTIDEPADVFWNVFLDNWCSCDGLWPLRKYLLSTLRRRASELSPIEFMSTDDRLFYAQLPEGFTVYRRCGRRRVRSFPWTTDRGVAAYFARGGRFPQPPDPVIASAEIAKTDLFFVSVDRRESEVVIDPYRIARLCLEAVA